MNLSILTKIQDQLPTRFRMTTKLNQLIKLRHSLVDLQQLHNHLNFLTINQSFQLHHPCIHLHRTSPRKIIPIFLNQISMEHLHQSIKQQNQLDQSNSPTSISKWKAVLTRINNTILHLMFQNKYSLYFQNQHHIKATSITQNLAILYTPLQQISPLTPLKSISLSTIPHNHSNKTISTTSIPRHK